MRLVSTGSVSVSRVPLPRKLLGQVLHRDSVAVGTEEDMSLGSGQSPGEGADPHASPGRRPPPPDDAQPPPFPPPAPMRLMTAVTVMRRAQEGRTLGRCPLPSENPRTATVCANPSHGPRR